VGVESIWKGYQKSSAEGVGFGEGAAPQKIFVFLISKWLSFYAFLVIFIDTVLFKKGTLIRRVGVRTPWTQNSADRWMYKMQS